MNNLFYRISIYFMVIFRHGKNQSLEQLIATDETAIKLYLKLNQNSNDFLEKSLKELIDES